MSSVNRAGVVDLLTQRRTMPVEIENCEDGVVNPEAGVLFQGLQQLYTSFFSSVALIGVLAVNMLTSNAI